MCIELMKRAIAAHVPRRIQRFFSAQTGKVITGSMSDGLAVSNVVDVPRRVSLNAQGDLCTLLFNAHSTQEALQIQRARARSIENIAVKSAKISVLNLPLLNPEKTAYQTRDEAGPQGNPVCAPAGRGEGHIQL